MPTLSPLQLEAKLFKGFADTSRLSILQTLMDEEKTVTQIAEETSLSQPNTSTHLACLLECGLIRKRKQGREVWYEIASKEAADVLHAAQKFLKKHSKDIYLCTRY
jgi:DNA-binding transcriptional ArsR family regulator